MLVKRLRQSPHLLAERIGRDRKEHDRADDRREVFCRRSTRCLPLLLPRLRGPEQPPLHIPHPGRPACTEVHRIPIDICPTCPVRSRNRSRVAVQSDGKIDSPATGQIFHLDCDCDRRAGRGTRFGDPVCPWAICIEDPKGEDLRHWSTGATDLKGVPPTAFGTSDGRVRPPRRRNETGQHRHTAIPQGQVLGTRGPPRWTGWLADWGTARPAL